MAITHSSKYTVAFSFAVPLLSLAVTIAIYCHSLSLVVSLDVTICHSLYHSLSLAVIRCYSFYHSLSLVVPLAVTRCYSLSLVLPLVVIRCHSLSLDVPHVCLFINDLKNVRRSQPFISMNFCTEFSKAQVLPCEYR